jgi:nucleotide-binding universal stress UspA family protein
MAGQPDGISAELQAPLFHGESLLQNTVRAAMRESTRKERRDMFREIMVPLDGSERAEQALSSAVQLATSLAATLHLVRVDDFVASVSSTFAAPYISPGVYEAELKHVDTYLATIQRRLAGAGLQIRSDVLSGTAALSLLAYEDSEHIDLLVMCSHGLTGVARFALGSVADRLLRHGSVPMLLVRAFNAPPDLTRVVVPLDGSILAEAALKVVSALARSVIHEVTLLRVIGDRAEESEAQAYLTTAALALEHENVTCRTRVVVGEPAETIIDVAGKEALVVMATHGRSGLSRWVLGSVADRVSRDGGSGILLVRTGARSPLPA